MRYNEYGEHDQKYQDAIETVFDGFNTRTRPDALAGGTLQLSQNFRFDRAGTARVRDSITLKSAPLALDGTTAFTLPFYAYGLPDDNTTTSNNVDTTSITRTGTTLRLTMDAADNFFVNDTLVFIGAITGLTDYSTGNYKITARTSTYIEVVIAGIGGTPSGNTTLGAPRLQDSFVTRVYGSCVFADPKNEGEQYIILAGNASATAVKVSDASTTTITYDSGAIFIGENVNLIQALNKVYLFRKGQTTLEWNQSLTGSPNFTKVPNGSYTQPQEYASNNNTEILNGKVTVTENSHGLETGNIISVIESAHDTLNVGDQFRVTKIDDNSFYFYATADDTSGAITNKFIGRVSDGGGFIHSPAPEFGILHQDRLVVPYAYTSDSSPVKRDQVDEILFSEAFFPDQFDPIFGFGRMFPGTDDRVVGLFSFADEKLIAFNRNSIFIFGDVTTLPGTKELVTQELGLVARRSVVQVGNQILFLSDNGVYGVSFQDLYNLRGNDVPLSEPIQSIFDNINKSQWDRSVAVYFDNRYYISIPLDDDDLTNGQSSENNNCLLIFNFLNKKWESIDNVGTVARDGTPVSWDIQNLLVAGDGDDRAVYAINSLGGIHKIDGSNTIGDDNLVTNIGSSTLSVPFPPIIRTKQYNFKTSQRKKWNEFELQVKSNDNISSDIDIRFTTENEDKIIGIGSLSDFNDTGDPLRPGEDLSIRGRIGNVRAYGIDAEFTVTSGKPEIKLFRVTGGLTFNSTQPSE